MNVFLFLISGFLGASLGSFVNVVVYRFGASTIHKGRSICLSCGQKIKIRDLVPIFSYLFLGGKCSNCKTKISPQYILVELLMTILGIFVYVTAPKFYSFPVLMSYIFYYIVIMAFLVTIAVYDFKHKIIPDEFSFTFALLALLGLFFKNGVLLIPDAWSLLAGPLLALVPAGLFYFSNGKWMGLGDAKLFLGVGFLLGNLGYSAFILSFWLGALVSIALMRIPDSKLSVKSRIPFAPFIIASTLIVFFTKINVLDLNSFF